MQAQDKPEYTAPAPMDVVLDTNVVLDWLLFADPAAAPLAAALETGRLRWVASPSMLDELLLVLQRPLPVKWNSDRERLLTSNPTRRACLLPEPTPGAGGRLICGDASDQKFIDLALTHRCAWLFSHDRALLRLARRARARGVHVAPPRAYRPD